MRRFVLIAVFALLTVAAANPVPAFRDLALTSPPSTFGPTKPHQPFAVVMDVAGQKRVVSVLATSNGGAALYLSTGGATIVRADRETLRNAAIAMVLEAAKQVGQLKPATKYYDYPKKGDVSFFVRTPEGTLTATVPESELRGRLHPLSPLYEAGQKVITELRRFPMSK